METILKLQLYGFRLVVILILWLSCDRRKSARADIDARLYRALLLSIALMIISASYYVFHTLPIGFFISTVRVEDHVARLGGDEFVVLVDFKDPMAMEELVRRIEREIENLNRSKQRMYSLSSSIGRSAYRQEEGGGASDFLSLLDADIYARKKEKAKGREGA